MAKARSAIYSWRVRKVRRWLVSILAFRPKRLIVKRQLVFVVVMLAGRGYQTPVIQSCSSTAFGFAYRNGRTGWTSALRRHGVRVLQRLHIGPQ